MIEKPATPSDPQSVAERRPYIPSQKILFLISYECHPSLRYHFNEKVERKEGNEGSPENSISCDELEYKIGGGTKLSSVVRIQKSEKRNNFFVTHFVDRRHHRTARSAESNAGFKSGRIKIVGLWYNPGPMGNRIISRTPFADNR